MRGAVQHPACVSAWFELACMLQAVAVLVDVYDSVLPCFPPSFDPLDVFAKEFTEQSSYVLDALGQAAPMLDNGSLLSLLAWPDSYRRTLLGLGVSDAAMQLSTRPRVRTPLGDSVPLHGLDVARLVYIDRIREQLAAAFRNLADIDLLREPEPDGRGRLWTPGVIELFRFLTQQVQLAAGVRDAEVVSNVAGVALQIMQSCAPPPLCSRPWQPTAAPLPAAGLCAGSYLSCQLRQDVCTRAVFMPKVRRSERVRFGRTASSVRSRSAVEKCSSETDDARILAKSLVIPVFDRTGVRPTLKYASSMLILINTRICVHQPRGGSPPAPPPPTDNGFLLR